MCELVHVKKNVILPQSGFGEYKVNVICISERIKFHLGCQKKQRTP